MKKSLIILGVSLLLGSCSHIDADHSFQTVPDTSLEVINEQLELQELNENVFALNGQFGVVETRSNWWKKFWCIVGSDAVGAVIGGVSSGWWGALGVGVASSVSAYKVGKDLDRLYGNGSNSSSGSGSNTSSNNNHSSAFGISSVVGYDDRGYEIVYDDAYLYEAQEFVDIEEEIMTNLGSLHNQIIISLYQQYGDNLATLSNNELVDRSIELVGSWYGLDDSEIPCLAVDDDIFESCILENEEEYDLLMDDYPEYAGYFPILRNFITAVSQLESSEQIYSYKTQAMSLIQNSNLSPSTKRSLRSGLDVLVCSNSLWVLDEEEDVAEEDCTEEEEEDVTEEDCTEEEEEE